MPAQLAGAVRAGAQAHLAAAMVVGGLGQCPVRIQGVAQAPGDAGERARVEAGRLLDQECLDRFGVPELDHGRKVADRLGDRPSPSLAYRARGLGRGNDRKQWW